LWAFRSNKKALSLGARCFSTRSGHAIPFRSIAERGLPKTTPRPHHPRCEKRHVASSDHLVGSGGTINSRRRTPALTNWRRAGLLNSICLVVPDCPAWVIRAAFAMSGIRPVCPNSDRTAGIAGRLISNVPSPEVPGAIRLPRRRGPATPGGMPSPSALAVLRLNRRPALEFRPLAAINESEPCEAFHILALPSECRTESFATAE
jgi:hypothetical protein